jgi:hypothetical protein
LEAQITERTNLTIDFWEGVGCEEKTSQNIYIVEGYS